MSVLIHLNLHTMKSDEFDDKSDMYLIAAYNKLPNECTAENLPKREYRPWLIKITEEVNAKNMKMLDVLDVVLRLQQLRKGGRLGNRTKNTKENINGSIDGLSDAGEEEFDDERRRNSTADIIDGHAVDTGDRDGGPDAHRVHIDSRSV